MSRVCSSSNRWYQAYTPQHFTHYLKVKYFSEWAHGIYESIYVRLDERVTYSRAREAIKKGKAALSIARQLRKEANHFPAQLCQLMKLDWEYCIRSCMAIDEILSGNQGHEAELVEVHRNYIAQRSQYVDEEDLDIRLGRSGNVFGELSGTFSSAESILERAINPLDIDLEEMIIQIRDSVAHMVVSDRIDNDKFTNNLINHYDARFAMQRKAVRLLEQLIKSVQTSEDQLDDLDLQLHNESEAIPIELNRLYLCSSHYLIHVLAPPEVQNQ